MVDLGWSWWVSTIIAASVAVASAAGFAFARSPLARGVLATLAVEGLVLAAIAPAVMKENSASTRAMTAAAFAARADANCAALNKFAATLGKPTTPPAIATQLDKLIPAFWEKIAAQGALAPPAGKAPVVGTWMQAMAAYGGDLEQIHSAALRGDTKAMARANAKLSADGAASARASRRLGLKVCFS